MTARSSVVTRQRNVGGKPSLAREAEAEGSLSLGPKSRRAIREGAVEKGDPLAAGGLAGLLAMKRTAGLLPHCHLVALTNSSVTLTRTGGGVRAIARAEAYGPTGVEMETLVGVSVALLTVWDMVKYLEKDARGQYPHTLLGPVRVVRKSKGGDPPP